jgi:broad specificity phosphatase PhoE
MAQPREGKIILVRHGETEANLRRCFADSDDIPLTEAGQSQAHEAALRLSREFRPQLLISSTFFRARQTSGIIGNVLSLATEAIPGIHERHFGCLKGHPYGRLEEMMALDRLKPNPVKPWLWSPAGGESLDAVRQRAIDAIDALRVRYHGQEIVVVSHGAVIQALCAHITGQWSEASVPPNCGIVTFVYDAEGWQVPILSEKQEYLS